MAGNGAVLIAGPTASGKSAAALVLAERLGGVVINADSMQVYAGLRILTSRPGAEDERRVPHALYGHVPPREAYSVGHWAADAAKAFSAAGRAGLVPIIVGGTGLYFLALHGGLAPIPDIPAAVRERWRKAAAERGGPGLHAELRERDPIMADRLRPSDPQRLVRALEVIESTGVSLAVWQAEEGERLIDRDRVTRVVIEPDREKLYAQINGRFERMLEEGALDEVAGLVRLGLGANRPIMRALGVRPLAALLRNEIDRPEAVRRSQTESRRYAKRQLTWFRRRMAGWARAADADQAITMLEGVIR